MSEPESIIITDGAAAVPSSTLSEPTPKHAAKHATKHGITTERKQKPASKSVGQTGVSDRILVIDVGGTHVKAQAGNPDTAVSPTEQEVKIPSGPEMTAQKMVDALRQAFPDWTFAGISMGYPGPVVHSRPLREPSNLGAGWVGFDFEKAFDCPVKIVNDAAMQALGSYRKGRMLFLGLGTGLGSAMIVDGLLESLELAHLPYRKGRTYEDYVGLRGLERLGKKKWRREVADVIGLLQNALEPDYVVLGGGNAKFMKELPKDVELGSNNNAIAGGLRLWAKAQAAG